MEISHQILLVLYISVLGMGLVFGAIGLMWAALAFMVFLTSSRQAKKVNDLSSEYKEKDDNNLKLQVAALAAAVAIAKRKSTLPGEFPLPQTAIVSAWQAVLRSHILSKRGQIR